MFNANETWSEKDKQIINVKTTRNNWGNLSNTISQFYRRLAESSAVLRSCAYGYGRLSCFHLYKGRVSGFIACGVYVGGGRRKVDLIQIQGTWPPVMQSG